MLNFLLCVWQSLPVVSSINLRTIEKWKFAPSWKKIMKIGWVVGTGQQILNAGGSTITNHNRGAHGFRVTGQWGSHQVERTLPRVQTLEIHFLHSSRVYSTFWKGMARPYSHVKNGNIKQYLNQCDLKNGIKKRTNGYHKAEVCTV